jgi:hypothetical protein
MQEPHGGFQIRLSEAQNAFLTDQLITACSWATPAARMARRILL